MKKNKFPSIRKGRYKSVGSMLWSVCHGYRGKSKKWAYRRSKYAMRMTEQFKDDPNIVNVRKMAENRLISLNR